VIRHLSHGARRRTAAVAVVAVVAAIATLLAPQSTTAANAWSLCLYRGSLRPDLVAAHEQWLGGRRMQSVLEFIAYDSWYRVENPSNQIKAWAGTPYDVVFSTPMLPADGSSTLRLGAQGSYDAKWRSFAKVMMDNGRGNARVRLGSEFNHDYFPWTAAGGREADFAAYYRRIVTVTRNAGAKFRFTWNVLARGQKANVEAAYPGDAYVDVISLDVYDDVYNVKDFNQRWYQLRTQKYGIDWLKSFATAQNKPMAFDEWGLSYSTDPSKVDPLTNSGDDTVFINKMLDFFSTERVAYGCYFDVRTAYGSRDCRIMNGPYPNASATYRSRLSGTSTTTTTTSSTSTTTSTASGDVALIVGNAASLPPKDAPIKSRLTALGKRVRLVDDDAVTSSALSGVASIVISSSVVPTKVPSWLATYAVPVLNLEAYAQSTLRLASSGTEHAGQTLVKIVNAAHPLAGGRSGDVTVQTSAPLGAGQPVSSAAVVARSASGTAALYGIERGAALTSGTAPARRVGFFFSYDSPPALSSAGWTLFDAAVRWLG
jgi:hypothetical protein